MGAGAVQRGVSALFLTPLDLVGTSRRMVNASMAGPGGALRVGAVIVAQLSDSSVVQANGFGTPGSSAATRWREPCVTRRPSYRRGQRHLRLPVPEVGLCRYYGLLGSGWGGDRPVYAFIRL
jgi:hypothetical protein